MTPGRPATPDSDQCKVLARDLRIADQRLDTCMDSARPAILQQRLAIKDKLCNKDKCNTCEQTRIDTKRRLDKQAARRYHARHKATNIRELELQLEAAENAIIKLKQVCQDNHVHPDQYAGIYPQSCA